MVIHHKLFMISKINLYFKTVRYLVETAKASEVFTDAFREYNDSGFS